MAILMQCSRFKLPEHVSDVCHCPHVLQTGHASRMSKLEGDTSGDGHLRWYAKRAVQVFNLVDKVGWGVGISYHNHRRQKVGENTGVCYCHCSINIYIFFFGPERGGRRGHGGYSN